MNADKLTKPQIILYWMMMCSATQGSLDERDYDTLLKNKVFKDKKSISNALYQLNKAGYIAKHVDNWCITQNGLDYIMSILNASNSSKPNSTQTKYSGPSKSEWTDADFGITPEVRAYIDKLEAENNKLKSTISSLELKLNEIQDSVFASNKIIEHLKEDNAYLSNLHKSNLANYDFIVDENSKLKKRIDKLISEKPSQNTDEHLNAQCYDELLKAIHSVANAICSMQQ